MVDSLVNSLKDSLPPELVVFIISMLPLAELRGGLIAAAALGIAWPQAFAICVVGNMVPIPFIMMFLRRIFNYLRRTKYAKRLMAWLDRKAKKGSETVNKYKMLGLFILVAIPLPGTGAWTGALVADALDIRMRKAMPIIFIGVIVAGLLISLISYVLWPLIFG